MKGKVFEEEKKNTPSLPHPSFFFNSSTFKNPVPLQFSFLPDVIENEKITKKETCEVIYRLPISVPFSNFSVNISIYFRVVCQYLSSFANC
jgi:hypothetical protein